MLFLSPPQLNLHDIIPESFSGCVAVIDICARKIQFRFFLNTPTDTNIFLLYPQESVESSLQIIHDISTENIGTLCINKLYSPLKIPLNTQRYDGARQKSDLASVILQDLGFNRHSGELILNAIKTFSFNQRHVVLSQHN